MRLARVAKQYAFSLIELLIALGITSIFALIFSTIMAQFMSNNAALVGDPDTSSYREEVKSMMRRHDMTLPNKPSLCMTTLAPTLSASTMIDDGHLIKLSDVANTAANAVKSANHIDLGALNVLKTSQVRYGALEVKDVYVNNIHEITSRAAVHLSNPGEVAASARLLTGTTNSVFLVQADYTVEMGLPQNPKGSTANKFTKPLKLKFAIQTSASGATFLDCGYGDIESTLTDIDVCKSFGPDFEYFYDQFDGVQGHGQCYAPEYDPQAVPGFVADGKTVMAKPTAYVPLRGFFCELATQGKEFLFNYCTGVQ